MSSSPRRITLRIFRRRNYQFTRLNLLSLRDLVNRFNKVGHLVHNAVLVAAVDGFTVARVTILRSIRWEHSAHFSGAEWAFQRVNQLSIRFS
jgi:hypothetical protein